MLGAVTSNNCVCRLNMSHGTMYAGTAWARVHTGYLLRVLTALRVQHALRRSPPEFHLNVDMECLRINLASKFIE